MRHWLELASLLCLADLSCDPVMGLRGEVRTVPNPAKAQGEVYDSGKPIPGATVTLMCRGAKVSEVKTDAKGRFGWAAIGWLDTACTVEIRADAYHPQRLEVDDLCVEREGKDCNFMHVFAELVPQRMARSPSP